MKSKIVRQLGAMLLAGAMIVTCGNVTTYATEQTDESVEVEETQEDELYGADMHFVDKIAEGDGYFICKESLCGKEKYVAYILEDRTKRTSDDILSEILSYGYMTPGNVIALTTKKQEIRLDNRFIKKIIENGMKVKVSVCFFDPMDYYDIYAESINDIEQNYSFCVSYNDNIANEFCEKGIVGYNFTIRDIDSTKVTYDKFFGDGEVSLHKCMKNDMYKKSLAKEKMKLYYYDNIRKKYVLMEENLDFDCNKVENNKKVDMSYLELKSSKINYYGTYIVCNSNLPDSMVFNLTGLEKSGDNLFYYKNGLRDTSYTGLCDYDGNTYYVKNGSVDYSANMLYDYNGSTWNIKNGKVDKTESVTMDNGMLVYTKNGKTSNETTLCKYNGEWYYIHNGKVDYNANTLCKYNGSWWYIQNGKVNFKYTGLCKFNGSWWYVSGGRVNFNATGLCKYNGSWWYVSGGRVNFSATGLCKYNGSWWYVSGGRVNFNATGLCKYNGSWWYVSGGRVNFNATGLCKYNGTWWYVSKGKVSFNYSGLCKYNGNWFYVEKGAVRFKTTLCKYNGTWWYINNGVVNFSKTTLCKYGKNWYAVSKGKVAWNYTGYMNYNGKNYKVVKGIVKF